jgi:hypothetical protein
MTVAHPRLIRFVHRSPGRLRLRLGWLRSAPEEAEPLADELASLDRSMEVVVRAWTGSVLCRFDPERIDEARIVTAVRHHTRVAIVLGPGEAPPPTAFATNGRGSTIRDAITESVRGMNRDVVQATDGRLDLGALAGLGFLTLGAAEIAVTRTLPVPPWFNLAWWAFRTFTLSARTRTDDEEDNGLDAASSDVVEAEEA